jgi:hypothetical protein
MARLVQNATANNNVRKISNPGLIGGVATSGMRVNGPSLCIKDHPWDFPGWRPSDRSDSFLAVGPFPA